MNFKELERLISGNEHRTLELKKSTGELKEGMHTACAFLNTDGGWLIFGIAPNSLKIIGQQVTEATKREIAQALSGIEPAANAYIDYVTIPESNNQVICLHFDGFVWGKYPYTYLGRPYYKVESITKVMPRDMYDERIEIESPGNFPYQITPETIKQQHRSYPWNPIIADFLFKTTFIENWGSGAKRIMDACNEHKIPEPIWKEDGGFVIISFSRNNKDLGGQIGGQKIDDILINLIRNNPRITRKQMSEITGKSQSYIQRRLYKLKEAKKIERIGRTINSYWKIIE